MKRRFLFLIALCVALFTVLAVLPAGSAAASADEESAQTSDVSAKGGVLAALDKGVQVFSMVILFGGLALLPLYFVLNSRRKRIASAFEEQSGDGTPPDENVHH